jgi:glycerol-3-phosphate dehydrogenase
MAALKATMEPGKELDILIVGGGIVGTGAALDAVTRGLSVGIVEASDWAAGTSSRSSKLIHGGLRYLEMLDFGLVKEALHERGLLLSEIAPHLARPVPFLYPLTKPFLERPYVGAGIALYDVMSISSGHQRGVPFHKHLSRRGTLRAAPSLKDDAFVGSIRYYDGQVDDAKYVANLIRTAAYYGAHAVNQTAVVDFLREGERVVGAKVVNREDGSTFSIRAKQVINATGVWTDETQAMVTDRGQLKVRASKGIHLVVPRDRFQSTVGLILRTEKSVLFVIPWGRHWIIGTTDTAWDLDLAHPAASRTDIEYLLEHVNKLLMVPLDLRDVEGVYAGLRPLLAGKPGRGVGSGGEGEVATTKVSREHTVVSPTPGLVLIAGGKLTTYRVMARDAIDLAVKYWSGVAPSHTERVPLLGADGFLTRTNQRVSLSRRSGLEVGRIDHLLGRYGGLVDDLLELVSLRPELAEPLPGAEDYLSAEVVYAVTHEGARHLDDVLARRTRISIVTFDRGTLAVTAAADLMAAELGWDRARRDDEVDHYLRRVEAERQSQEKLTDQEADEARVSAPDIV